MRRAGALLLGAVAMLPGCGFLRPARTPMPSLSLTGPDRGSHTLIVLLPGRRNGPEEFASERFPEMAAAAGVDADLMAVDAHFGYYRTRTIVTRLRADVILPARERGYRRIWLAGVSLGALGSLLYQMSYPDDLAGVLLLAPYLGEPKQVRKIREAGGVRAWTPAASESGFPWDLWIWAKGYPEQASGLPPVWLGFGEADSFAKANRLFSEVLPTDRVFPSQGGHDWKTWAGLWERFLRSAPLTLQGD